MSLFEGLRWYGWSNYLDRHNTLPAPRDDEEREAFALLRHVMEQRGCTFTEELVPCGGKLVLGRRMYGTRVPP